MLTTALATITIPEAAGLSLLGILVVFVGLIVLMFVITLLSKLAGNTKRVNEGSDSNQPAISEPVQVESMQTSQQSTANNGVAPGSAGEIKLYNVPDKQAAMVMAIVADHLKTPLNQLRFKSIKRLD